MKDIRIAAAIFHSPVGRLEENLEKTIQWVRTAKKSGVELICFPELNLTGYSIHSSILKYEKTVHDQVIEKLAQLSKSENMIILAGMIEGSSIEGRVYASHLVIQPEKPPEIYRKIHIAPPEKNIFISGNTIPIFKTEKITFGIQLCYDAHFPELSTCMAMAGADIIFIPHASPRNTPDLKYQSWIRHLPARASDNGVFVIACNQNGENTDGLQFPGIALIIGPDGNIMQKDLNGKEGLVIADLKSKDLWAVRGHRMRYFFPNRRPDLYHLK